jgi:hypothetical protein
MAVVRSWRMLRVSGSHLFIVARLARRDMTGAEVGYSFRLWQSPLGPPAKWAGPEG